MSIDSWLADLKLSVAQQTEFMLDGGKTLLNRYQMILLSAKTTLPAGVEVHVTGAHGEESIKGGPMSARSRIFWINAGDTVTIVRSHVPSLSVPFAIPAPPRPPVPLSSSATSAPPAPPRPPVPSSSSAASAPPAPHANDGDVRMPCIGPGPLVSDIRDVYSSGDLIAPVINTSFPITPELREILALIGGSFK